MQTGAANLENSMETPQKVKNTTTLWSSNFTTGYLPPKHKNTNSKGYIHPCIYSSIIYNSQDMEAAQLFLHWGIKKRWCVCVCTYICIHTYMCIYVYTHTHTHNGLFSHEKEWNIAICEDMDGTREYNAKWTSQRQISWFHTYVEFKKQNKWAKGKRQTDKPKNRLLIMEYKHGYQGGGGGDVLNRWWGLRKALVMSTGWWNHSIVHLKWILHCMLNSWN